MHLLKYIKVGLVILLNMTNVTFANLIVGSARKHWQSWNEGKSG